MSQVCSIGLQHFVFYTFSLSLCCCIPSWWSSLLTCLHVYVSLSSSLFVGRYVIIFLFVSQSLPINMNNPTDFFQLRKLREKALRYSFHQENYNFFAVSRLIPAGLQICHSPQIGELSPQLRKKWNQILYSASIQLIQVLSEQCAITLQNVHQDINNLDSKLRSNCSESQ